MKRKQMTRIVAPALGAAIIAACVAEPELVLPDPGFGIISTGQTRYGMDRFLPYARTTGRLANTLITGEVIIPSGATGTVGVFDVTTNSKSRAVVPGGIAPAFWIVTAGSNWNFVSGTSGSGPNVVNCVGKRAPRP